MNCNLILPSAVSNLLSRLTRAGFSAYVVGGCVRDALLGIAPHDWDICTSALPEQMQEVFHDLHTVETGLKHGTLTVVVDHEPYEVTTFRVDGDYTDHRHPDSVCFVDNLTEDLARRDFTVNAMAWSPDTGLADPFNGQQDLADNLIRCVGEAEKRFDEDALRILRALRFASVYDFAIEPATSAALRKMAPDLSRVAGERIREELLKLLCGKAAGRILREYPEVLAEIIPEIRPMIGYGQQNHHHSYDLWEHTVRGIEGVPAEPILRLTMLLHDTGKIAARTTDEKGEGHYKGQRLCNLVLHHDIPLRTESGAINTDRSFLLRRLNRFGEEDLRTLFLIHRSDRVATGYTTQEREDARLKERMAALDTLLAEQPCFTLKDLAVNGRDLIAAGLKGKAVGEALQALLEAVMDGKVPNEKDALLSEIRK